MLGDVGGQEREVAKGHGREETTGGGEGRPGEDGEANGYSSTTLKTTTLLLLNEATPTKTQVVAMGEGRGA